MKKSNGITLIALIITIVVLMILAGITIGSITGSKGTLKTTNDEMLLYELNEIQQAILELKIKYNQTDAQSYLDGIKITRDEANSLLTEIKEESGDLTLSLKLDESDDTTSDGKSYYKLVKNNLSHMGLANSEDEYIINYSTGEVFNITTKTTSDGRPLYISVEE